MKNQAHHSVSCTFSIPSHEGTGWLWQRLVAADMDVNISPEAYLALDAWLMSSEPGDEFDIYGCDGDIFNLVRDPHGLCVDTGDRCPMVACSAPGTAWMLAA